MKFDRQVVKRVFASFVILWTWHISVAAQADLDAAKKEGKLVWYVSHFPATTAEDVARAFEAKYPGIKVDVVRASGQVIYQRVVAELQAGVNKGDVLSLGDEGQSQLLKKNGHLARYTPADNDATIPALRNFDPDGYFHVGTASFVVIGYNTKKVTSRPPSHWKDLLDSRWAGQIAIASPSFSPAFMAVVIQLTKMHGWGYWEQMSKQKPLISRSLLEPGMVLSVGERAVGIVASPAILSGIAKGHPVEIVYPEEGSFIHIAPVAMMARAPNPNAARLFLDFTRSLEYSRATVRHYFYPLRADVALPPNMKTLTEVKPFRPSTQELIDEGPKIIELFRSTFGV